MTEALVTVVVVLVALLSLSWRRQRRPAASSEDGDRAAARLRQEVRDLRLAGIRSNEILDRIDEGVLVFSDILAVVAMNRAARRMLGVRGDPLPTHPTFEGVLSVARRSLVEGNTTEEVVSVWPARTRLRLRATPLRDGQGVMVVLRDVTEELTTQRIRQQFVANASHELKSPVAGLQALAEAIREAAGEDPPAARRFSTKLIAEADRLGRLIADLLDLSGLEEPGNVSYAPIDLSAVTRQVVESTDGAARARRIAVNAHIGAGIYVRGDGQHLSLLVRNLVDNAVRYTSEGGSVWVDVFREGDDAVLRVSDDGIGIPLKAQARVFERFYRVDKDRSRESGGTGLGLSIAKHVVELHGGNIGVDSQLGDGSTFTARLPALEAPSGNRPNPSPHKDPRDARAERTA